MLRVFSNTLLNTTANHYNYQILRWLPRKPRWMPMAKSKLFRVPPRQTLPEEEADEIKRLFNNYRTSTKSLRRFLTYRYSILLQAKADTALEKKLFEEDLARCRAVNEKWNEETRVNREKRVAEELAKDIEFAKNRIKAVLQEQQDLLHKVEELVRKEKNAVTSFITPESLDEVIEKAINNPVDYNFAIDLDGNTIIGKDAHISDKIIIKQ